MRRRLSWAWWEAELAALAGFGESRLVAEVLEAVRRRRAAGRN